MFHEFAPLINAPFRFFAETLDQERAQVPLWGPAPVSGATFLRLG